MLTPPEPFRILIVDDLPRNIQLVAAILRRENYQLSFAQSGAAALDLVKERPFDLILLDLHMPGMDGYSVCQALQEDPNTCNIPIIFVTANTHTHSIVQGLQSGAVDYITKPFEPPELLARVRAHLELKHSRDTVQAQKEMLERLNQDKSELLGIVAHDLKNPLAAIISAAQHLEHALETHPDPKVQRRLHHIHTAAWRMNAIIYNFLNLDAIESGRMLLFPEWWNIHDLLLQGIERHRTWADEKNIQLHLQPADRPASLYIDRMAMEQVLDNLISNAIKYSPQHRSIWVRVRLSDPPGNLQIEVEDQGPGLSEADQSRLFVRFGRLSNHPTQGENATGLGLSIVKKLTELMGGHVHCESELGQGARFILRFDSAR
jgi:two-component system sensor histidine kinase/response regulator